MVVLFIIKILKFDKKLYLQEKTIETTGAGDAFCGCMIDFLLEHGIESLTQTQIKNFARFANAAASIVTTKKGALMSMPERRQILEFLSYMK